MKVYKKKDSDGSTLIVFEDCQDCIKFPNFAGEKKQFNDAGKRNFKIDVGEQDGELYNFFANENVNISKWNRKPSEYDENPEPLYSVKINVVFDSPRHPINLWLCNDKTKTKVAIGPDTAHELDHMGFKKATITAREYVAATYTSLYIKKAYFVMDSDEIDEEYSEYGAGGGYSKMPAPDNGDEDEELPFA